MPANPMGRGLPMATMVLPDEQAPEVSAEAGAEFLAVLAATQAPAVTSTVDAAGDAGTLVGGDTLSDPVVDHLALAGGPQPGGDTLSDPVVDHFALADGPQPGGDTLFAPVVDHLAPIVDHLAPVGGPQPGGDTLSAPAVDQVLARRGLDAVPPAVVAPVEPQLGSDDVSAPAADRRTPGLAPQTGGQPAPAPAGERPAPVEPRRRPAAARPAPVAAALEPAAPTPQAPSAEPTVDAPDVAAHVARATEAADAGSASSIRAHGLRHVRLAVPTDDGAVRARVTVDAATDSVDVAIRGTDDVGLTATQRVSELREALAHQGLELRNFDARAVGAEGPSSAEPGVHSDAGQPGRQFHDGAPADRRGDHARRSTGNSQGDPAPEPTRRSRWDDDAPTGQLLDLRI